MRFLFQQRQEGGQERTQIVKLRFSGMAQADSSTISFTVNGMNFLSESIPASFLTKAPGGDNHGSREITVDISILSADTDNAKIRHGLISPSLSSSLK